MGQVTYRAETPRMREAYREYIKLGINRSYDKLHEVLVDLWGRDAPSAGTIKDWGATFGWRARAIEDDEIINARAWERIRDQLARDIAERKKKRLLQADIQINDALNAIIAADPNSAHK